MDSRDRSKLLTISNDNCILIEFINEGSKICTGFVAWLEEKDQEKIQDHIKLGRIVKISWPNNVDTCEAEKLKGKLKKVEFKSFPVKILRQGNWTDMKCEERSMVKFGHPTTTKEDRKTLKRKVLEETESKQVDLKRKKKEATDALNAKVMQELQKSETLPDYPNEVEDDYIISDTDEEEEDGSDLETKIKKLEANDMAETMRVLSEDLARRDAEIVALKRDYEMLKNERNFLNQTIENLEEKVENLESENKKIEASLNEGNNMAVIRNLTSQFFDTLHKASKSTECRDTACSSGTNRSKVESPQALERDDFGHGSNSSNGSTFRNDDKKSTEKRKPVKSGAAYTLSATDLANVRTDCPSHMAADLLESVFGMEMLESHSVNGMPCNANKGRNIPVKPALDQAKLKAIKGYVATKFIKIREVKKIINLSVRAKLNEAAKQKALRERIERDMGEDNHPSSDEEK